MKLILITNPHSSSPASQFTNSRVDQLAGLKPYEVNTFEDNLQSANHEIPRTTALLGSAGEYA